MITLALGAAWLAIQMQQAPLGVLNFAVLPFLPGDALKVAAAAGIAVGVSRLKRAR